MNIFLAWSGPRSKAIATALHGWLPTIIQASKPWMSDLDVDKGRRWEADIADKLSDTDFGIVCLTPDNLSSTWIHFEAGAVAKALDKSRLWTFLYELSPADVEQPLGAFQHTEFTQVDVRKLLDSINKQIPSPIPEDSLDRIYDSLWPSFQKEMKKIPKPSSPKKPERKDRDILEEILESVRKLSRKSESTSEDFATSDVDLLMELFDDLVIDIDMVYRAFVNAMNEWDNTGTHLDFESSEQIKGTYRKRISASMLKLDNVFKTLRRLVPPKLFESMSAKKYTAESQLALIENRGLMK